MRSATIGTGGAALIITVLLASGACGGDRPSSTIPVWGTGDDGPSYGLEWSGEGRERSQLIWLNPFPLYDATYIFRVYPRKKTGPYNYFATFFWANDGSFEWHDGLGDTYYGAHPYPVPPPAGPGQWEISAHRDDKVTGTEVEWDRWYTQAFRAYRVSSSETVHEFYWDLPDLSRVIRFTIDDPDWGHVNPPNPSIQMGQVAWACYPGYEEFNGIIRGVQIYSGLLGIDEILAEISHPESTASGRDLIWYLNVDPRPDDVLDKKGIGAPNNPSWRGVPASGWTDNPATAATNPTPATVPQQPIVGMLRTAPGC